MALREPREEPYRLRPAGPFDLATMPLLRAVLQGAHVAHGFSNADLRRLLVPDADGDPHRRRQATGRITRLIRLLRAHRLVHKTARTRRYRVSPLGHTIISTALTFRDADLPLLAAA